MRSHTINFKRDNVANQITQTIGSKLKHIISMSEPSKFTKLYKNVKNCKNLSWQEKAILSEIISYQSDGKPFKLKDLTIAIELALDKGSVSKFIRQLALKDVISKNTITYPSHSGGKPKRLRTITVNEIEKWTESHAVPVIKTIEPSTKKNLEQMDTAKATIMDEVIKPVEQVIDNLLIQTIENKPSTKTMKIKKDMSFISDIMTLDSDEDIDNTNTIGRILIAKIKKKENVEFKKVNVKFGNEILTDEATLLQNGSNKYFLKSSLKVIDASVFE